MEGDGVPGVGHSAAHNPERIPRWLVVCERLGSTIYLSDVGGEVEGTYYIPAIVQVSLPEIVMDLPRMSIPIASATISVSPSSLHEHFIDVNELGQAHVTVSSWDGRKARRAIKADLEELGYGYDGKVTSFKLTEEFTYDPTYPERLISDGNGGGFTKGSLASGAKDRCYPVVWRSAPQVPGFALLADPNRWMVTGHNVKNLPTGPGGTAARYKDKTNATYIGKEFDESPSSPYWAFNRSLDLGTMGELLRYLIEGHSTYSKEETDAPTLEWQSSSRRTWCWRS